MDWGRQREIICSIGSLVVSVPLFGLSGPSFDLGPCCIFRSRYVNNEKVRDIWSA